MAFSRMSGILLHPISLPGGYGVGDMGKPAYEFVDFLADCGMKLWQILPLGPTGSANSPYQVLSSYAGNPILISLKELVEDQLLNSTDLDGGRFADDKAEYDRAREIKEKTLRIAFANFKSGRGEKELTSEFESFCAETWWLDDFSLFIALKEHFGGAAWFQWEDKALVRREPGALEKAKQKLAGEVEYHSFCQFVFFRQWRKLKAYANERNIVIMGDVPIYVAHDSADVWAAPEFFKLDEDGMTESVAGVPPDYFSATGQLWGNPIYDWKALKADGYKWWIDRIKATLEFVDLLRIDHFRGFEAYWEVPAGEETAVNGSWVKGPADDFFNKLKAELGELPIIAEDLGMITEEVHRFRKGQGIPGMAVLQFGFCDGAELYLPHNFEKNCVVYTATHDNDTTLGWYKADSADYAGKDRGALERERQKARQYLARNGFDIVKDMIRLAMSSVADIAILPMQDVLFLDNNCRMNLPGVSEGQWRWRMTGGQFANTNRDMLKEMVWLYQR